MTLVIDSSATLAWCFEDETTPGIDSIMQQVAHTDAHVPALRRLEIANGLQTALRRRRIDEAYRDATLVRLSFLDIRIDPESDTHVWRATVHLATQHGLTVYDARYLELAQRRRLPLATLDAALARAATAAGVTVIP